LKRTSRDGTGPCCLSKFAIAILFAVLPVLGSGTPAGAKPLPDLVIAEARLEASGQCGAGQPLVTGVVVVKNIGRGSGQIYTTRDMIRLRARGIPGLEGSAKFVNTMRPGDEQRVPVTMGAATQFKISGAVTIDIEVDPLEVFEEADEANNRASVQVTLNCR
jgi:hypothetical protein